MGTRSKNFSFRIGLIAIQPVLRGNSPKPGGFPIPYQKSLDALQKAFAEAIERKSVQPVDTKCPST